MAFVPDGAARRDHELTPTARRVYVAHCEFRNHSARLSFADDERVSQAYGIPLGSVRNAITELKKKGWIERTKEGWTRLLVGDFTPVDRPREAAPKASRNQEKIPESRNDFPETVNEIPGSVKEIPGSRNLHIKGSRARFDQPGNQPEDQPSTSTHTPAPPPATLEAAPNGSPPGEGSVCVNKTKHSAEIRLAYGRNHPDSIEQPERWAWSKRACAGEFDEAIDVWLASLEAGGEQPTRDMSACPDCRGSGMFYPAGDTPEGRRAGAKKCRHPRLGEELLASVAVGDLPASEFAELMTAIEALVEAQGRDPAEVIAAQDVSAGDRARLLERFRGRAGPPGEVVELKREGARV